MSAVDLLSLRFLLATFACLAAGLGIWAMVALCARFVPALSMQRSVWLLGEAVVAATFLVMLLPHTQALRVVPAIEIDAFAPVGSAQPGAARPATAAGPGGASPAQAAQRSWLIHGARAWLVVYLLGLGYAAARLLHGQRMLNRLAGAGCRVTDLEQHDGFGGRAAAPALTVIEVAAPISPMLLGPFRPRLILPRHLRSFDVVQQQMIVEHELTHLRRRDLQWMTAGFALQALFWFNPVMRMLRANLAWAQELGCDRDVLRGRSQAQRKAYAAALVAQLRLVHRPVNMAVAFGAISASTLAARVSLIRAPESATRGAWARCAACGALATVFVGNLSLQPVLAWKIDPSAPTSQGMLDKRLWPLGNATVQAAFRCTELADAATGKRLVHEGACDQRITPASTFNIVVSLMGYDSGILRDEHVPALPFKAGYADSIPAWRATTDPAAWIKNSTVWYAQQVASRLGAARFRHYVKSFDYGNQDVSGDPGKDNGLAFSWISSSLRISPSEQVAFLRKVVNRELPLTAHAYDMTSRLLKLPTLANGWEIYGKTGTASPVLSDGTEDRARSYGWFVGWATKGQRTVVFARLVLDNNQQNSFAGARVKASLLHDLPAQLNAL